MSLVACIIPFFNEGGRIGAVLSVVTRISQIHEVVCVDDGSTDGGAAWVQEHFPQVKVARIEKNSGKTAAVVRGLKETSANVIFLCDADLVGLHVGSVSQALEIMDQNGAPQMIVLRRHENILVRAHRGDILLGGERILTRRLLEQALSYKSARRYQLEIALNACVMRTSAKTGWLMSGHRHVDKMHKLGLVSGCKRFFSMVGDIMTYERRGEYARQVFCMKIVRYSND